MSFCVRVLNVCIQIPSREMGTRERALLCAVQGSLPQGTVCNTVSYKFFDKYLYIDIIVLKFLCLEGVEDFRIFFGEMLLYLHKGAFPLCIFCVIIG